MTMIYNISLSTSLLHYVLNVISMIKKSLSFIERKILLYQKKHFWARKDKERVKNVDLPELSNDSKKRIGEFWIKYIHSPIDYTYFRTVAFFLGKEPKDLHYYMPKYFPINYYFLYCFLQLNSLV